MRHLQAFTNMFSSSEFQQEFVELNLNLSDHFLDLSLALQLLKSPQQSATTVAGKGKEGSLLTNRHGQGSVVGTGEAQEGEAEIRRQDKEDLRKDLEQCAEIIGGEAGWKVSGRNGMV